MKFKNRVWHFDFPVKKISLFFFIIISLSVFSIAYESSIIFLSPVDIETLDPGKSSDSYSGEVLNNIFEGLVKAGTDLSKVEPGLAEKWKTSESGKVWDFYLRKGVKFHDGREFNADDVIYTFKNRIKNRSKYKYWNLYYAGLISDVIRLNKYKVRFKLKSPYVPFLFQLATTSALIIPSSLEKSGKFIPVGTGPFKFDGWRKGKYVSLIRFEGYRGVKAKVSKVVFKVVSNSVWRLIQIKSGKGDVTFITSGKEYGEVLNRRNLSISSFPSTTIHYLGFNVKKKPFDNVDVRRAFAHLMNKKYLIRNVFQNFAKNATTPVPQHIFGFNGSIKDYPYDIKKAKNLIKKAGYPEGFEVKLLYSSSSPNLDEIGSVLVRSAKKIGIKIIKVPISFQELRSFINKGTHDMFMMGWQGNIPDPDVFLYPVFSNSSGNLNRSGYYNPEVSALLDRGRSETDDIKRKRIYFKIQEIIHKDVPWIPLYNLNDILVYNKSISNIRINQFSLIFFKDVFKEKN